MGTDNYAFDETSTPVIQRKTRGSVTLSSINVAGLDQLAHKTKQKDADETTKKDEESNVGGDPGDDGNLANKSWFPKRRIILEPAFAMMFIFHFGSFSLTSQYMFYAFGEKYNLSAIQDQERKELNITGGGDGSRCSPDSGGGNFYNSSGYHALQAAQAENARFNVYMDLVNEIPGFFFTLMFGKVIDRLGRKPCMILPMVGFIIRGLVYITQMTLNLPIEIILLTGVCDALTGGVGTFFNAGFAFFADTIPRETRGKRLAINDVAYGLCNAAMAYAMGYMIQYWGFLWPLLICVGGSTLNLTYIIFFVPESRKKTDTWKKISPRYIVDSFKVFPKKRPFNGRKILMLGVAAYLVSFFSRSARGIDNLYRLNEPFCWTPVLMGTYSMVRSVLMNGSQVFVSLFLFKPLGDLGVLIMGITSGITDELLTGFAVLAPWLLWAVPITGCFAGVQAPVLRATMMKLVGPTEQGALFSSLSATSSLLGMGGSAMYNNIYAETLYFYKGTVFFVIAAFVTVYLILIIIFKYAFEKQQLEIAEAQTEKELKEVHDNQAFEKSEGSTQEAPGAKL